MKPSRLSLTATVALLATPAFVLWLRADDSLPKPQSVARYEPMATRSPFMAPSVALPVATPTPAPIGPHWWDQMAVTSLMEAGGTSFAGVIDHANNKRYVLERGKIDPDSQLQLADVQWNEHTDQSTITVRKGTELAPPLRFDTSASPASPTAPQQPFNPGRNPPNFAPPSLPPNFTVPPPPPSNTTVRRDSPIGARPNGPGQPNAATVNQPGGFNAPPRKVRPLGDNADN